MKAKLSVFIVFTLLSVGTAFSADKPKDNKPEADSTVQRVDRQTVLSDLQKEYRSVSEALNASYTIEQNELAKRLMLIEGRFEAYASIADSTLRLKK